MNDTPTVPGDPVPAVDDAMLEQAATFLSRLAADPDDEAGRAQVAAELHAWLAVVPVHAVAADIVSRSWQAAGDVRMAAGAAAAPRAAIAASPLRWRAAIAASVLLAASAALWRAETVAPVTYQTARGEQREIVLTDGSTLRMNVATTLSVRETWRARQVTLAEGEAQFVVAHDRLRPFTVAADRVTVRAIGTDFVVSRRDEGSYVLLVSGSVALADPGSDTVRAILKPGQKATYDAQTSPVIRNVTVADELAWQKGRVVFDRTPLSSALRILQRHADAQVLVPADMEQVQITGMYRTGDLPAFLDSIARILPVAWNRGDDGAYRIVRREKK